VHRHARNVWLAAGLALGMAACGGASSSTEPPAPPPVQTGVLAAQTVTVSGASRSMLRYLPTNAPTAPIPLVIVLHGGGDDAAVSSSTRPTTRWRELAESEKFAVVYPNGVGNNWRDCRSDATDLPVSDDVALLDAIIARVSQERAIDTMRVYVTGVSNGGMMSYRAAQAMRGRIAGIGAVVANLPDDPARSCPTTAPPLGVVIVNGTVDAIMPFTGGLVAADPARGRVQSAAATLDFWARTNGCAGAPTSTALPDLDATDQSTVVRLEYTACSSGRPLVFFRVDGGGHTAPSRRFVSPGRQNRDFEAADEIWRVLSGVRRQ
jgi:polyhydroxybutyrate depolymerase